MAQKKTNTSPKKQGSHLGAKVRLALAWTYRSVTRLVTLVVALLLVAAAFSDHISPNVWLWFSYLSIAFPIVLAIAIIWTIILLVLRRWKLGIVMVVVMGLLYEPICRYFPLNIGGQKAITHVESETGLPDPIRVDSLRLLTYNTCWMGQTHLSQIKEKIPVMEVVRNSGADIVCLQEYAFTLTPGGHTESQLRSSLKDIYPYYDYLHYYYRKAMGIAIFSKYPILHAERIDKNKSGYLASMYYELDVNGRRVALVNNHLQTNAIKPKDRELYDDMIEHFEKDSLQRIRSGLVRKLGSGFLTRAGQCNQILRFLESRSKESRDLPLIIVGDFNDTPFSYCYQTLRGNLCDAWQEAGLGPGITYNQHRFWFRIDHILHSPHLRALQIDVLRKFKYSDHYPVEAVFQLLPDNLVEK